MKGIDDLGRYGVSLRQGGLLKMLNGHGRASACPWREMVETRRGRRSLVAGSLGQINGGLNVTRDQNGALDPTDALQTLRRAVKR